ncbi:MAG TPA: thioredoxin domain-containing protein [Solirubrobacteraceae bacterium]|nr:thioredoxin domain-containing protein [Solirubrobacteraceae bacterium]
MSSIEGDEGDLTRKQRREAARAERKAMEEAHAANVARRTRLTQLGVVVAVVVVVIVVVLIATGGKSKSGLAKSKSEITSTTTAVSNLIGGIPQTANVLGSPTAPITLEYFGDLECPICKQFTLGSLPAVIPKWVRTGKLRIEYRSLETATREPEVFKTQQVAALAAGKQDKAWYYIETFYHEQGEEDSGYVTESYLQGIAKQVPGLNLTQWTSDRNDGELAKQVTSDEEAAKTNGFNGTPSFLIGRSGGAMSKLEFSGAPSNPTFVNTAVEKLLKS